MLTTTTLSIALLLAAAAPADAVDAKAVLEEVRAGEIHAERALTIIPLELAIDAEEPDAVIADVRDPKILIGTRGPERAESLVARNDDDVLRVLIPGHVVENGEKSYAVTSYAATSGGRVIDLDVANLSFDSEGESPRLAFRTLPPTLRWMALTQPNSGELRESVETWTRRWNTPDDEDSLKDLASADVMEKRVEGYVTPLLRLRPSADDRKIVGYIARLDDDVAVIELFGSSAAFATQWPSALRALAIEAVLAERNEGWLKRTIHGDSTPEFGGAQAEALLHDLAGLEYDRERIHRDLVVRRTSKGRNATMILSTLDGHLVHMIHTPDARKRTAPVFDDAEPADGRTKERDTGDVERIRERRGEGTDTGSDSDD